MDGEFRRTLGLICKPSSSKPDFFSIVQSQYRVFVQDFVLKCCKFEGNLEIEFIVNMAFYSKESLALLNISWLFPPTFLVSTFLSSRCEQAQHGFKLLNYL